MLPEYIRDAHVAERQSTLESMLRRVDAMYTDYGDDERGREVGVDPELREMIGVLLSLGINTESSCWGHPERQRGAHSDLPEHNILPYITLSGYHPEDGSDADREPIGYTKEQTDKACEKMAHNYALLSDILEQFYNAQPVASHPKRMIELQYSNRMPGMRIQTAHARDVSTLSEQAQDEIISEARQQWKQFITFLKQIYYEGAY